MARILIVDDDDMMRLVMKEHLSKGNAYAVLQFRSNRAK